MQDKGENYRMINFKHIIADEISKITNIEQKEIEGYIEVPNNEENGDYAFPCFKLAKSMKKAPQIIANRIKEKLEIDENIISKIDVVNGYINFYINNETLVKDVCKEIDDKKEKYGSSDEGKNQNIIVEYSAPNIAKEFHIGHLRTTVIGACFYNIFKYLGYNTTGINHLGDYGTQFGKIIEGYKRWGNEYNLDENPIEKLTEIYIRINELCKEDESVLEACRDNFKKLEDKDPYCVELWTKFKNLSLKEFNKTYDILGIKFDSTKGEAFYADKTQEVIDILKKNGKLEESQGAMIVDLSDKDMPPCIVCKSNGSSIYATRDLAAILYRARTYDFDKCIYVVSDEQKLYFKQIFEVAKYLDLDKKYTDGLVHVSYGMTRLATGKMSTREGNVIKVNDLLNEAISRVLDIINEKNPDMEEKQENAKKIGIGAIIFNNLCNTLAKEQIFDWNNVLNFNGETGPYIQYIYVRTKSVLEKAGYEPEIEEIDFAKLEDKESINVLKTIYKFNETLRAVIEKYEPSILARYLIELAQNYSNFYNENKIICDDKKVQDARIFLTKAVGEVLKTGAKLLGMEMPDKM